ncbi:hypothetical protein FALCPG4_018044 [Fusarium falciforme]
MQSVIHKVVGPQEVHPDNLVGRVAVVTGGALGIGYEVSRALALAGCKVIMVNRKDDQGHSAIDKVKSVFSELRDSLERLDYLVLSAGINANQYGLDSDGIERIFGVNYLGQYYATNQLWPLIRKTSPTPGVTGPRIVALSSDLHRASPSGLRFGSLDDINDSSLGPVELYARAKLALILFVRYGLYERVIKPNGDSVYALAVHPGAVNTAMQDQWKDAYPGVTGHLISYAMKFVGRDPEQGSYSTLWALTAPEIDENHKNGAYFTDPGVEGKESSKASDSELGAQLWELGEKVVKEKLGPEALVDWNEKRSG